MENERENQLPQEYLQEQTQPEKQDPAEEQAQPEVVPKNNDRKPNAFELTYAVSNLVCQIVTALAMIFGVATLFSHTLTPLSAVNDVIALFSIKRGNIYKTLSSAAVSVTYAIMLILTIKGTVYVIRHFIRIVKPSETQTKWNSLYYAYGVVKDCAFYAVILIALCRMIAGDVLSTGGYFAVITFLINYTLNTVLLFVHRHKAQLRNKETIAEFAFLVLRVVFVIVCSCLVAKYLIQPSIFDFAFGVRSIFIGVGWSARIVHVIYDFLLKHVFDFVLTVFYLKLVELLFREVGFMVPRITKFNDDVLSLVRKFLVVSGISAACACILLAVSGMGGAFNVSIVGTWYHMLKAQFLPTMLLMAVFLLFPETAFEKEKPTAQKQAAAA